MTVLRRIFYRIIVLCLLLAALTSAAFAAETEVASLSAQVTVSKSGASDVTVTAKLSFGEGVMQLNIPLGKDVSNVRLAGYSYKLRQRSGVTYLIVTNEAGFTGTQELTYSYSLPASVSRSGAQQRYRRAAGSTACGHTRSRSIFRPRSARVRAGRAAGMTT